MKVCSTCGEVYDDARRACAVDGTALQAVRDPLVGRTVGGRYRLITRLGAGGMSAVYLARHVLIDRLVAVKTLRRDLAQDPTHRDRFIREARAVNRINHANIVEISDYGETEDGLVYLVMEYVPGDSLSSALSEGALPTPRALAIAAQVGSALGRAHQMGVVHRDLKPENVLLVKKRDGVDFVKILDFGIAKIMDAPALTGSQQIFGTPGYIAPEYIQSTEIDGRADLYSLGVILYEMVTGALPFDYEFPGDLLVKHVTEPPVPPRQRNPDVEPALEALVLRCLAKDPDQRFRDAYHFLDELNKTRERLGSVDTWGAMNEPAAPEASCPAKPAVRRASVAGEPSAAGAEPSTSRGVEPRPAPEPTSDAPRKSSPAPGRRIPSPPSGVAEGPAEGAEMGMVGVRRWRERYEALVAAVDELRAERDVPSDIDDTLRFCTLTLTNLERAIDETEEHQRAIEDINARARDFRSTLGRAIDQLGQKHSHARGALEELAQRRSRLRTKREGLLRKIRGGEGGATAEGAADALLWELASVEQALRHQAAECDGIEAQLGELRLQLERRNEEVEARLAQLVQRADAEMIRIDALAHALREPLDRVQVFVEAVWSELEA